MEARQKSTKIMNALQHIIYGILKNAPFFPGRARLSWKFHTGKQQIETFCGFWKNKLQEHWCIEMTFEKRGKMFCHYQKITNLKIKNFLFCLCYPMPVCAVNILYFQAGGSEGSFYYDSEKRRKK